MQDEAQAAELLSKRELEVAAAYAEGLSYKEIARDLGVSPTTIRSHLRTVYGKLGVTSKIALSQALIDPKAASEAERDAASLTADLALELDDAMRRERMMARVLRLVSRRDADLDAVIDEVIDQALDICEAEFGVLFEHHGGLRFSAMRSRNIAPAFASWLAERGEFAVDPATGLGRVAETLSVVNIADVRGEEAYSERASLRVATAELGGARSFAAIPMLSGDRLIGVFTVYRTRVHPFNERALELAQAFADQAVIAIENVRQFRALQNRLARAAASREILEAIRTSREDAVPVFDVILKHARQLCDAPFAALALGKEGDAHQVMAAHHGAVESTEEIYREGRIPMDPVRSFAARSIIEKRAIHLPDMRDTDEYRAGYPNVVALCDNQGIRTNLFVPLISNGEGIGCFIIFRHEVRPYSDDQISLVETFAAQAVIALENVQQFRALEARTAEVQALNASLEEKVAAQVGEIERVGRLKQFLSPAVAEVFVSQGEERRLASHRALIATLFCDIRGFTAFCETAEPEETIEVLQAYHEEMGNLISAHGGGVDKRMADGIMVIFNDPIACDDPAGDAARLAIAMRERMRALCGRWRRLGHRLGFGVGISFGYATVGMVGSAGRFDYTASGTSVNTAARLCDIAGDDEILLSPRAFAAIEDAFAAESRGAVEIKGIREPMEIFALRA
ncbi:MAG: GAF domain-containing protein [Pikeienuella sp.]|uniref:GAF domain-containing protein n=1 Tax=Pikeienuella sp. TaxID=2831957 RepID=UPI00391DF715